MPYFLKMEITAIMNELLHQRLKSMFFEKKFFSKVIKTKNKYQVMLYSVFVQKNLWIFLQIALFRLFKALWNICECVDDKVSSAGLKYTCVGVTLLNFIFYFAHFPPAFLLHSFILGKETTCQKQKSVEIHFSLSFLESTTQLRSFLMRWVVSGFLLWIKT